MPINLFVWACWLYGHCYCYYRKNRMIHPCPSTCLENSPWIWSHILQRLEICGLMKLGCKIWINIETDHNGLISYLQMQTKLSFVHLCLCFPIYVHILLSFGSLGFLVIIIIAYGNDIVISLDLCLSLWCEVSCCDFWKCYCYHFEFVPLCVFGWLVWGFLFLLLLLL